MGGREREKINYPIQKGIERGRGRKLIISTPIQRVGKLVGWL